MAEGFRKPLMELTMLPMAKDRLIYSEDYADAVERRW